MISLASATLARRAVLLGAGSAAIATVLARPAAALAQESGTPAATPGAMVTAMPAVIQRWIDAMNARDAAAIAALFAPEGAYENAPLGTSFRGADIEPLFAGFFSVVGDFHVEPRAAFAADDWAAVEWLWTSTDQGLFQAAGMPATGKPFAVQGVWIFALEGERIRRIADYYDVASIMGQLGLLPGAGGGATPTA